MSEQPMDPAQAIMQVFAEWRHSFDENVRDLRTAVADAAAGVAEVRANQKAASVVLDQVLRQTTLTNGRVTILEGRADSLERREIRDDAIADGRREQRAEYLGWMGRLWAAVWSTPGRIAGAVALLSAGWTIRDLWPW